MKVTTESGTVYRIENGYWQRNEGTPNRLNVMKSVPEDVETWGELHDSNLPAPQIGFRMYLENRDVWQISTNVVSIEEADE